MEPASRVFHMTSRRPYWFPNETAAMLASQANPVVVELFSYASAFFCSNKFAKIRPRE